MAPAAITSSGPPFFRRPEVRFPLRFAVLSTVMAAAWAALAPVWPAATAATAATVAWAARLCGLTAVAEPGAHVAFSGSHADVFRFVVTDGCTALPLMMIFGVAVLAYPATRRQRTLGLMLGLFVLFVANLGRLMAIGWVGLHAPGHLAAVHEYWGQALFIALVGGGWFAWAWWVAGGSTSTAAATPRQPTTTMASALRAAAVRRAAVQATIIAGVLASLAVVGLAAHGVAFWGLLVRIPQAALAPVLDLKMPLQLPEHLMARSYGLHYAALAAVMTLFVLTPRAPWRARLRGALLDGVPSVYLIQVTTGIVLLTFAGAMRSNAPLQPEAPGVGGAIGSTVNTIFLALHVAVPAFAWHRWNQQRAARERAREQRKLARRQRKRRRR